MGAANQVARKIQRYSLAWISQSGHRARDISSRHLAIFPRDFRSAFTMAGDNIFYQCSGATCADYRVSDWGEFAIRSPFAKPMPHCPTVVENIEC
jgi:hypothetical protein